MGLGWEEDHPIRHPDVCGELHQLGGLVGLPVAPRRTAHHGQDHVTGDLRSSRNRLGQCADGHLRPLERLETAHEQQQAGVGQMQARPGLVLGPGSEQRAIHPWRHDADPPGVRPIQADQVVRLEGRGGQDPVGPGDDPSLSGQSNVRLGPVSIGEH